MGRRGSAGGRRPRPRGRAAFFDGPDASPPVERDHAGAPDRGGPAAPEQKRKDTKVKEVAPAVPKQKSKVVKVKEVRSSSVLKQKKKGVKKGSVTAVQSADEKKRGKSQLGLFDLKKKE